jgi:hypothetical protein
VPLLPKHTSAYALSECLYYLSIRQHTLCQSASTTQAYVSIRQRTSAYVSIRQHTDEPLRGQCASTTQSRYYDLYYTKPSLLALLPKAGICEALTARCQLFTTSFTTSFTASIGTDSALRRSVLRALAAPIEAVKLAVKLVVKRPARFASAAAALTSGSAYCSSKTSSKASSKASSKETCEVRKRSSSVDARKHARTHASPREHAAIGVVSFFRGPNTRLFAHRRHSGRYIERRSAVAAGVQETRSVCVSAYLRAWGTHALKAAVQY